MTSIRQDDIALDVASVRQIFGDHPAGVSVVTADAGAGPVALTATSLFSASAEPPILVFSISDSSSSSPTIAVAETFVIHLLDADDRALGVLCSTSGVDRFSGEQPWERLPTGEPYFPGARRWVRVQPVDRMVAGTATVLAVLALEHGERRTDAAAGETAAPSPSRPLVYHGRRWHGIGDHSALG
jgi:flavin reductase (DIM6/NTAB) family NADH-FMN oxidoreductase RutF